MKILHVVHQFLPEHVGGTEAYTRALATAQQAAGHEPHVFARRFAPGRDCREETFAGLPVIRAVDGTFSATGRFRDTLRAAHIGACLECAVVALRPDVVHLQHAMGIPAPALGRVVAGTPTVGTLHDYWWVCANAQLHTSYSGEVCDGPRAWLNCGRCGLARVAGSGAWPLAPAAAPLFAWRDRALSRVAAGVAAWIAPTDFVRAWHVARGFPPDRTHTIQHGIELPDEEVVAAGRADRRDDGPLRVAYLGGLSAQKGVHVLVEAVAGADERLRLEIAGDEAVFPEYCAELRRAAPEGRVRFLGLLGQEAVWRTVAAAHVVVVPSLWYETSSLIAQEAFAAGTPVVASDLGALSERVRHEVDGLKVPPGDAAALREALLRLADSPELLLRLRAGIQPVQSMRAHAARVEERYRQVLAR